MEKKNGYISPEVEIIFLANNDILTTSGGAEGTPDGSWDEN